LVRRRAELKKLLIKQGMADIDASTLIKIAKNKKTSVSWQFFWSLSGLYWYTFFMILAYFFFTREMNEKEYTLFTIIYLSLFLIMFYFTPFLRKLLWSLKVLFTLRGR